MTAKRPVPKSHREIIEQWPDIHVFCEDMKVPYETGRKWTYRQIPPFHFYQLVQMANKRGYHGDFALLHKLYDAGKLVEAA